jgi:hypothetical protein
MMIAVVVAVFGTVTDWLPSFGTSFASTENVTPPSREMITSTFAQETGAISVFATLHVTVCVELPGHVTPVAVG